MRVLGIGEILWDVFPDRELLGGAALNFCVNTLRLGDAAAIVTAVGNDARGRGALDAMRALGLPTNLIEVTDDLPTGAARVTTDSNGDPRFDIPRPAAFDRANPHAALALQPDWIYFGTLLQMEPRIEQATRQLIQSLPQTRIFYDMNLRPDNWNTPLVERLSRLATVVKLNEAEARMLAPQVGLTTSDALPVFCQRWTTQYSIEAICITLGPAGCLIYHNGAIHQASGFPVTVADTVGAGDAFAAAFLHGFHRNWPLPRTARFANALGSLVASRPGAIPAWSIAECLAVAASNPI